MNLRNITWRPKPSERRLALLTLLVLFYSVQAAILRPLRRAANESDLRAKESQSLVQGLETEYARLSALARAPVRTEEILSKFDEKNDRLSTFLVDLAKRSGRSRFRITRLTTEISKPIEEYIQTPVNIDIETSFPAIGKFLEQLEDSTVLAEIDSLEIYRQANDLKKCSARIKLLSYAVKK